VALAVIDQIGDGATRQAGPIAADQPVVVTGWALDGAARQPATAVYLLLDGRYTYRAEYGAARPDVAATAGGANDDNVGFTATLPPGMATPGRRHTLAVRIVTTDGSAYADSSPLATFTVEAPATS